ncbi:unnamed protein product, partial [Ixodes pacificus]
MRELGMADVLWVPRMCHNEKVVGHNPLYFQLFVPKRRTCYPLSFGPLNQTRLVKSQSKIIYPSPKFLPWPL